MYRRKVRRFNQRRHVRRRPLGMKYIPIRETWVRHKRLQPSFLAPQYCHGLPRKQFTDRQTDRQTVRSTPTQH